MQEKVNFGSNYKAKLEMNGTAIGTAINQENTVSRK